MGINGYFVGEIFLTIIKYTDSIIRAWKWEKGSDFISYLYQTLALRQLDGNRLPSLPARLLHPTLQLAVLLVIVLCTYSSGLAQMPMNA